MTFRNTLLAAGIAAALPGLARAQQHDAAADLDAVVVTGTRTAVTADASLAAVEVIDRAQIERSQARSLPELLRARAGINLVNLGGLGKLSTLFVRGAESDHTLFLVDGVRVGSATSGLAAVQDIPVELIERIEIVRGPRSSLYGADAIGGVIQVFTRRTGEGVRPHASLGAGSERLRQLGAGVDLGFRRAWLGVDYSHQSSDGIDSCRGAATPVFAGCFMDNPDPDRDGYENNAVSLRAGATPADALTLQGHVLRAEAVNAFDADPAWGLPDTSRTLQQVAGGSVRHDAGGALALTLTAGRNLDRSEERLDGAFVDRFLSTRDSASLQADVTLAPSQLLTLGVDWQRDAAAVEAAYSSFAALRYNRAAFVQHQAQVGRHALQASLRRDDNGQFGAHTTGSLAWAMDLGQHLRATASAGTAFKAPSFNELYYPYYGNPDLRPETSTSLELGLAGHGAAWHWALNAYRTDIDQLIVYDTTRMGANNLAGARIRGAELTGGLQARDWVVTASASVLDPRNRGGAAGAADPDRGNRLPRRARASARIDADHVRGAWRYGASVVAEGRRYDDVANRIAVGGYGLLDLRLERTLAPDWTLQAKVGNAFDRQYETAAFYRQPGRTWGLTLRYAPAH